MGILARIIGYVLVVAIFILLIIVTICLLVTAKVSCEGLYIVSMVIGCTNLAIFSILVLWGLGNLCLLDWYTIALNVFWCFDVYMFVELIIICIIYVLTKLKYFLFKKTGKKPEFFVFSGFFSIKIQNVYFI